LLLDIETAPFLSYIWSLWKELGNTSMMVKEWYVLCWSAKWLGEKKMFTGRVVGDNDKSCLLKLRKLLDQCDIVLAQNGDEFDIKKIYTRFIFHSIPPPSPFRTIDTLKIARKKFSFTSNRLDDLGKFLGLGKKMNTGGFQLWRDVISGSRKALDKMIRYCKNDVILLEKIYLKMRPYIDYHPHLGILGSKNSCHNCGSVNVHFRGFGVNNRGRYRKYQCQKCGTWGISKL